MTRNTKKIIQALAYLSYHINGQTLSDMKAYKLLWLADRCQLRQKGRTITGDRYYALPKGMVPTDAKHLLDGEASSMETPEGYYDKWLVKVGSHKFKAVKAPDLSEFSKSDIDVLDRVLDLYGGKSRRELSELSHKYPEWQRYEDMLSDKNAKNSFPIDMDLMFENSDEDSSLLFDQPNEVLEVTKDIYHEFNS